MRSAKGVTLIELVILIAVISILGLIAIPSIAGTLNSLGINLAAMKLAGDVRYARELALSQHKVCGLEALAASNSYQVFCVTGGAKVLITDPLKRVSMAMNYGTQVEFSGVAITAVDFCQGASCATQELRFNEFGIPRDVGGTVFTTPATITITKGGVSKTVNVTQETGFTEIV